MKNKELIEILKKFPENSEVTTRDLTDNIWSNIQYLSYKHSSDRIFINFNYKK